MRGEGTFWSIYAKHYFDLHSLADDNTCLLYLGLLARIGLGTWSCFQPVRTKSYAELPGDGLSALVISPAFSVLKPSSPKGELRGCNAVSPSSTGTAKIPPHLLTGQRRGPLL